jgi:predicted transcriptional regulator
VLTYVRNNPGSSGEQIAEEMATDTATLRPVLRELIAGKTVTTSGKGRGTRYAAG